jgi:hypothetical protein
MEGGSPRRNQGEAQRALRHLAMRRMAPGIRTNLSKTGSSLSVGRLRATGNFSTRGTKATVGLPGSGISYSTMLSSGPPAALPAAERSLINGGRFR